MFLITRHSLWACRDSCHILHTGRKTITLWCISPFFLHLSKCQYVCPYVCVCVIRMQVLLTARVLIFFLWLTLDRNSVMETHRQDQRGNISTVLCFYSGETLGADVFVSWPCLCCFHSFLGSPCQEGNKKVTVCTRVHYLSRNKGVNCKHQKIIFVQ